MSKSNRTNYPSSPYLDYEDAEKSVDFLVDYLTRQLDKYGPDKKNYILLLFTVYFLCQLCF